MKRLLVLILALLFAVPVAVPVWADTVVVGTGTACDNTAYDATSWNGDATYAPCKDAVRDKIESLGGTFGSYLPLTGGNIGTTAAGGNLTVNATLGTELITAPMVTGGWTMTDGWSITAGVLSRAGGTTTGTATAVSGMTSVPTAGVTYKVTIVCSAAANSPTYTLGGVTGTTITATTITDYITAGTTAKIIFSGGTTATATISSVSILPLTDATGDLTVAGNLKLGSPIQNMKGQNVITIGPTGNVGIGTTSPGANLNVYSSTAQNALVVRANNTETWTVDQYGDLMQSGGLVMIHDNNLAGSTMAYSNSGDTYITSGYNNAQAHNILLIPSGNGNVGIGTTGPVSRLHIGVAPTASANYGLLSLGSAPFDGATSGYFVGSASGTHIAINAVTGYAGDLVNLQKNGVSQFKVDNAGVSTQAGASSATSFTATTGGFNSTASTTVGGYVTLLEGSNNGTNFRKSSVPAALTANVELQHADALPAANQFQLFPAPSTGVSQYTWTTYGQFGALDLATTGTVQGGIKINSDANGMSAAEMTAVGLYGTLFIATGTGTWILPTAVAGMSGCLMDSGTNHDLILDVQDGDDIQLKGTEQANGVGITNAATTTTGDFVCVVAISAGHWVTMGMGGVWASQ